MRRPLTFLFTGLFALALLAAGSLARVPAVTALTTIAPTTTCANGEDNTPGLGLICEVTIINTITPAGGTATVTVRECHGAAGDPQASCITTPAVLSAPVTIVNQCNNSINGAGGTLRCSVQVTNNFVGLSPTPTAATVWQCDGSGDGVANTCSPFPATVTGATITQCNGSANGGNLVQLTCTVPNTATSAGNVSINQCNGSANGGGALVICSANISNNVIAAATPTPAPTATPAPGATATPAPGATATARPTAPPTSTAQLASGQSGTAVLLVSGLVFLCALSLITVARRQTRSR